MKKTEKQVDFLPNAVRIRFHIPRRLVSCSSRTKYTVMTASAKTHAINGEVTMTTAQFEIDAQTRTQHGKAYSRRLRRLEGALPGVVYGAEQAPVSITLNHNTLKTILNNDATYSRVLTLNIDSKPEQVIIKDLQRHPWRQEILHIDFQRIKAGENMTISVPVHFLNEDACAGIKAGGILSRLVNDVEVTCLPKDLPESFELDLTDLALDQTYHLSDLTLPEGVSFAHTIEGEQNHSVVSVHTSHAKEEVEEAHAVEAATEAAEEKE